MIQLASVCEEDQGGAGWEKGKVGAEKLGVVNLGCWPGQKHPEEGRRSFKECC